MRIAGIRVLRNLALEHPNEYRWEVDHLLTNGAGQRAKWARWQGAVGEGVAGGAGLVEGQEGIEHGGHVGQPHLESGHGAMPDFLEPTDRW